MSSKDLMYKLIRDGIVKTFMKFELDQEKADIIADRMIQDHNIIVKPSYEFAQLFIMNLFPGCERAHHLPEFITSRLSRNPKLTNNNSRLALLKSLGLSKNDYNVSGSEFVMKLFNAIFCNPNLDHKNLLILLLKEIQKFTVGNNSDLDDIDGYMEMITTN